MTKDLIFFIAYKACSGKNFHWNDNPFQYINSIFLLTFILLIHFLQIVSLIKKEFILSIKSISGTQYFFLIAALLLVFFLLGKVYPKKDLPKAIREYKGSRFDKYSKLIAYGYLVLNLILFMIIIMVR